MSARFSCLSDWLAWQETAHPVKIDLSLDRVREVLGRLALPLAGVPVITVAGTNGKGSTVAFAEHILRHAGYCTGAYTSPHLLRYNERVRIDGLPVDDDTLCAAFERIDAARGEVSLSYFEWATLAALTIFAGRNCQVLLLEVGLGGRLDAVNIVDADVAIISSVDLDHQQFLGETREAIGAEKVAVARAGRPLIVADRDPPASVLAYATDIDASVWRFGVDYKASTSGDGTWCWQTAANALTLPVPDLPGAMQIRNAASAVLAVHLLTQRLPVPVSAFVAGVAHARIGGRFERRGHRLEWVLDVAHNPEAARNLAENLRAYPAAGRTVAVLGVLGDKDAVGMVGPLAGLIDAWHLAALDGPRGSTAQQLAARLAEVLPSAVRCHRTVAAACQAASAEADTDEWRRIVVFGSFQTVEQALRSGLLPTDGYN